MRDKSCAWMSEPRQSPPPPLSRLPGRQHGPLEVLEQPPRLPATVRKIERLLAPQRPRQRWLRGRPSGNGRPAVVSSTRLAPVPASIRDRKSTRLNSSHVAISYADFC